MGYVGVKGGRDAILNAEKVVEYYRCRHGGTPVRVNDIQHQMRCLIDKVISEGSLYAPHVAAIAVKQTEGDPMEAAYLVRALRSTVARSGFTLSADSDEMFCIRRISSSFQDIPWGQVLGPSRDYAQRLIRFDLEEETRFSVDPPRCRDDSPLDTPVEKVVTYLRKQGLLNTPEKDPDHQPYDITRQPLTYPMERSARLQRLTRGEEGALLALGYAGLRGWGGAHPTLAEVRVGYLPVRIRHPYWKTPVTIGRVLVTEVESICEFERTRDRDTGQETCRFTMGYGLVFGHNERKAIAMSILDRALCAEKPASPIEDQEFVLSHIDSMESQGFISHLKLPHYVSFQSELDRIRRIRSENRQGGTTSGQGENHV